MATVSVSVFVVYRMMELDNSVMREIQERIAPERMPDFIIGIVILKKVVILLAPNDLEASSVDNGICCKTAVDERNVYCILLKINAITINIKAGIARYFVLKVMAKAMPRTEPGMIYGIIVEISNPFVKVFLFLTVT